MSRWATIQGLRRREEFKKMNTAVIVAASEFNEQKFREMDDDSDFDYVMAVDGGYDHLLKIGKRADIILGDFDSVREQPFGIRACKFPTEKDDSDLQLTMTRLLAYDYSRVFVFGALGGRLDHLLANLRVCAQAARRGLEVIIIGVSETVYVLGDNQVWEQEQGELDAGTTVSVMQLEGPVEGLFIRGLKWEGDDLNITDQPSLCLSNVSTDEPILIGLESGSVAIIVNNKISA